MSLKEAYSLAHTAQCRLQMEVNRPERNLRFVVGHLMHYEHLRLRIVEIEHDISKSERASAVAFHGTGHVADHRLQHKPSTGQLGGKKSPPPPAADFEDEDDDEEDDDDDDHEFDDEVEGIEEDLGLTRFPSATANPPRAPPDLVPDYADDEDEDEDEPTSPEEPDRATLEHAMKGESNENLAKYYASTRSCPCHGKTDAPALGRVWELPKSEKRPHREGVTIAVAEVQA
ncbi:hypothetical protein BAUCODRAFT_356775 [Baudoinia panamericana UAMH 10762]|uniref:Uncharacterized protein n=1 Tax=Baudoinia panamericana (strain UAMH 10762) TaxID=717646 RepID=M2NKI6_BAUPA|nr:uncharacterized protein BAUCODRAFT_356775 [Baudoinia panamericana UAMH 10762]EMC99949.1 hypothetical protein BAUCODRAFT_356775 [Baudoinia panamericana UAMH 10762]